MIASLNSWLSKTEKILLFLLLPVAEQSWAVMKWSTTQPLKQSYQGQRRNQRSRLCFRDSLGFIVSRAGKLGFLHEGMLPSCLVPVPNNSHSTGFSSVLGIVLGFHSHLREMWVDVCLCSICAASVQSVMFCEGNVCVHARLGLWGAALSITE